MDAGKRKDEEICAQEMAIPSAEEDQKKINSVQVDVVVGTNSFITDTQPDASTSSHGQVPSDQKFLEDGSLHVDLELGQKETENEKVVFSEKADAGHAELVCRVCHLNLAKHHECGEAMILGCNCKEDLAVAHRRCAEAWFKVKGNKICEICGVTANNVTGMEDAEFMSQFNPQTHHPRSSPSPRWGNRQPLMNLFIAIIIAALVLPWIFHYHLFS